MKKALLYLLLAAACAGARSAGEKKLPPAQGAVTVVDSPETSPIDDPAVQISHR